jgi:hypothetical protein
MRGHGHASAGLRDPRGLPEASLKKSQLFASWSWPAWKGEVVIPYRYYSPPHSSYPDVYVLSDNGQKQLSLQRVNSAAPTPSEAGTVDLKRSLPLLEHVAAAC